MGRLPNWLRAAGFEMLFIRDVDDAELMRIAGDQSWTIVTRERVPPFIFSMRDKFLDCHDCRMLSWRGAHWRNMRSEIASFQGGA